MPCRDEFAEDLRRRERDVEGALTKAGLCAILTALGDKSSLFEETLSKVDWKEAGIKKRELLSWWEQHKEEDRARREREKRVKHEKKIRKEALSKLSDEEKKILGIKG